MDAIIYIISFIFFFFISLRVFLSLNIEQLFKRGYVWEIKTFTLLSSLVFAHILAEIILKIFSFQIFN